MISAGYCSTLAHVHVQMTRGERRRPSRSCRNPSQRAGVADVRVPVRGRTGQHRHEEQVSGVVGVAALVQIRAERLAAQQAARAVAPARGCGSDGGPGHAAAARTGSVRDIAPKTEEAAQDASGTGTAQVRQRHHGHADGADVDVSVAEEAGAVIEQRVAGRRVDRLARHAELAVEAEQLAVVAADDNARRDVDGAPGAADARACTQRRGSHQWPASQAPAAAAAAAPAAHVRAGRSAVLLQRHVRSARAQARLAVLLVQMHLGARRKRQQPGRSQAAHAAAENGHLHAGGGRSPASRRSRDGVRVGGPTAAQPTVASDGAMAGHGDDRRWWRRRMRGDRAGRDGRGADVGAGRRAAGSLWDPGKKCVRRSRIASDGPQGPARDRQSRRPRCFLTHGLEAPARHRGAAPRRRTRARRPARRRGTLVGRRRRGGGRRGAGRPWGTARRGRQRRDDDGDDDEWRQ